MPSEFEVNAPAQWKRVESELRACKESQIRAWGDVDDLTLGRYLAGEVSEEERRQIEQALHQLPNLRLLTDLVRDVLDDCPPAEDPIVPFTAPLPPKIRPRRTFWTRVRPYLALAAAACLLLSLAFGVSYLRSGPDPLNSSSFAGADVRTSGFQPTDLSFSAPMSDPIAAHRDGLEQFAYEAERLQWQGQLKESLAAVDKAEGLLVNQDNAIRMISETPAASDNPPKAASLCTRLALVSQNAGDVDRSERFLSQAYQLNRKHLGEHAPATVSTRQALATCYGFALNGEQRALPDLHACGLTNGYVAASYPEKGKELRPAGAAILQAKWKEERVVQSANTLRDRIVLSPAETREVVVPALVDAVKITPKTADRIQFVRALAKLGPAAADALPLLIERLEQGESAEEKLAALEALGKLKDRARPAIAAITRALDSPQAAVRTSADLTLRLLGPTAHDGLAELEREGFPGLSRAGSDSARSILTATSGTR
jgi:hypothetical protein